MLAKLIMFLCHIQHKRYGNDLLYIKGKGKDYPKYLLYTENENVYSRMDNF
ncbi:hypothetical protein U2I53_10700 [Lysinibacillus capsici]|uniref:hypothetical protein n=1 Tax=Lysinibacillus capsici TaxID=2115968 RepID=UPI0032E0094D